MTIAAGASPDAVRRGAYGLVPRGPVELADQWLIPAPESWPQWHFTWSHESDPAAAYAARNGSFLGPDFARLPVLPTGFVEISRAAATSHFVLDHELTGPELLHPGMASTAATLAWWDGRLALHGAAVCNGAGEAVAFLGEREHGKSTSAAWMRSQGWEAVSDDVLVIDGRAVLAGPRIIDLRETTARRFAVGESVGTLGQRERWRLECDLVPPAATLSAIVCLEWGDQPTIETLTVQQRLEAFVRHNVLQTKPRNEIALLTLVSVPMFVFTRPPGLDRIDDMMNSLVTSLGVAEPRRL